MVSDRWFKIILAIIISAILIWALVPRQWLYIGGGITAAIIGIIIYRIPKGQRAKSLKAAWGKFVKVIKELSKPTQATIDKVPELSDTEKGNFKNAVGNKCENPRCDQTHFLRVHHIIPRAKGGSNKLNNVIVLCENCHTAAHGNAYGRGQIQSWVRNPKRFRFHLKWKYK